MISSTTGTGTSSPRRATAVSRVPVWVWRALMTRLSAGDARHERVEPITGIDYTFDVDYAGDGIRAHRLDVLVPHGAREPLPVYIYFHGGGWTSGDKAPLTEYAASQAADGMIVINANYRKATRFQVTHMLEDGNAVLEWVARNVPALGGDASRIIIGGDSAGGHIAALLTASAYNPELAAHHGITPAVPKDSLRGLVQHCSIADFSVMFERNFVLSRNFLRMLLPERGRGLVLRAAARFLSPIEWLDRGFPPVFVTTSERDFFYRANLNFIDALTSKAIAVDTLIYQWAHANTRHTWQQNARHPESQEVYRRLGAFVRAVAPASAAVASASVASAVSVASASVAAVASASVASVLPFRVASILPSLTPRFAAPLGLVA